MDRKYSHKMRRVSTSLIRNPVSSHFHCIGLYAHYNNRQFSQVLTYTDVSLFEFEQALNHSFINFWRKEGFPISANIATFVCQPGIVKRGLTTPLHDYKSLLVQVSREYFDSGVAVTITYNAELTPAELTSVDPQSAHPTPPFEIMLDDCPSKSFYRSVVNRFQPKYLHTLFNTK